MEAAETNLLSSNPTDHKRVLVFKSTSVAHAAGDATEFDLIMGQLPENDGLTSSDEGEDEDDDEMEEQEEEEEMVDAE